MESLEAFVEEAERYVDWAIHQQPGEADGARIALIRICRLYSAALLLPRPPTGILEDATDDLKSDEDEISKVVVCNSLPMDLYGEVFNPLTIPPEEPGIASIADDITDIYRDVVRGLCTYRRGDRATAHWEWTSSFACHWGKHATGAVRALHAWLAEYADDRLANPL